jgi:DNA-binding NarL/FixJ family response regulator
MEHYNVTLLSDVNSYWHQRLEPCIQAPSQLFVCDKTTDFEEICSKHLRVIAIDAGYIGDEISLVERIVKCMPGVNVIILNDKSDGKFYRIREFFRMGVKDYILKSVSDNELFTTVNAAIQFSLQLKWRK